MLNFKELNKVNKMSKNEFTKWLDENFERTGCEEGLYFRSLNNENINFYVEFTTEGVYEYFKKTDEYKNFCDECLTKEQIEEYEDMLDKDDFSKLKKEYEFEPELKEYYAPISVLHDMVGNFYEANDNFLDYNIAYNTREYIVEEINKAIEELVELGGFESSQMEQIRLGLEDGLDISMYADPKFNREQMKEIRLGLKEGLDVSKYADPKFDWEQMLETTLGLECGLDVSKYADPKFNKWQMKQIRLGLKEGLDVSKYADPKFNEWQMKEIREGLKCGLDVSKYADPKFDWEQMLETREGLEKELDISTKNRKQDNTKKMMR